MRCNNCRLCQYSMTQVLPYGSNEPDIYFVIDSPDEDDLRFGEIMSGSRGMFFKKFLEAVGITNYRIWSMTRCLPYKIDYADDNGNGEFLGSTNGASVRKSTEDEINSCKNYVMLDIAKTKPKVVVTLGSSPTKHLLEDPSKFTNITSYRGRIIENGSGYIQLPTFSPSYIINNQTNTEVVQSFMGDLKKAKDISEGTYVDLMKDNEMFFAKTYEEFKTYVMNNLMDSEDIAYDIETNAELVYSSDFDVIGWSLAVKRKGVYVCVDSLDYTMSPEDRTRCEQLLVAVLSSKKKVIVHNSLYERPATLYKYGYDFGFEKLDDTLVMAKLMLGGKIGAGLKANAQKIGYPSWDDDMNNCINIFKTLLKRLSLAKYRPVVSDLRLGKSLLTIKSDYLKEDSINSNNDNADKFAEIIDFSESFYDSFRDYYEPSEIPELFELLTPRILKGFDEGIPGTIPYNWIPTRMLGKYGAIDALATYDLKDHFHERFRKESTPEVQLFEGYKYALAEHYAGFAMAMASLKWDDSAASRDYEMFDGICVQSLKTLLDHPESLRYVYNNHKDSYIPKILYEFYNDYLWDNFDVRIAIKSQDDDKTVYNMQYKDGERIKNKHIKHLMPAIEGKLNPSISSDLESRVIEAINNDVRNTNDLQGLKGYFNPASTTDDVSELATAVIVTKDFKFARFVKLMQELTDNVQFNDKYEKGLLSNVDNEFVRIIKDYLTITRNTDDWINERTTRYEKLKSYVFSNKFNSPEIKKCLKNANDFVMDGLSDGAQITIYETLCVSPIDPDDDSTWTTEFKWLVAVRWYKKSMKIMSAYINGKVGRASVWVVDKNALESGNDLVYRKRTYQDSDFDENGNILLGPDEALIEQTNFGVGTAETGRWRSAFHVLPSGSSVKKLYTSRFKGGTILQPDFSANELRCVASAAKEENMLQAFREGKDIHRSNASKIYRVPEEEVTEFQRRFAKTLCVHGDTEIRLLSGKTKTISELHKEFLEGNLNEWVYSYCKDTGQVIPCRINGVSQDRSESTYVEVTLDNGSVIRTTLDHELKLRDGSPCQVKDLKTGDSLMAVYFDKTSKVNNYHLGEGYELLKDPDGEWIPTHRRVGQTVELSKNEVSGTVIHHIDFDKTNNSPDNLELIDYKHHLKLHGKSSLNIAKKVVDDYIESDSELDRLVRRYNTDRHDTIQEYVAEMMVDRHLGRSLNKYVSNKDESILELLVRFSSDQLLLATLEEALERSYQSVKSRKGQYNSEPILKWDSERSSYSRALVTDSVNDELLNVKITKLELLKGLRLLIDNGFSKDELLNDISGCLEIYKDSTGNSLVGYPYLEHMFLEHFNSVSEAVDEAMTYNHSVVKVEFVNSETPVKFYDLFINYNHNYLIDLGDESGVISENSFMTLYGGSAHSMADGYFEGDVAKAQEQLDSFFSAFPELKTWIDIRHNECLTTGKVSVLTHRFLNIDFDPSDPRSVATAKRCAQNYKSLT